jgi:hypothetical protein
MLVDVEPAGVRTKPQVFVGVIPQEYHLVKTNVTPGQTTTIPVTVRKASNYHVIVYTVTGIDADGNAIKSYSTGTFVVDALPPGQFTFAPANEPSAITNFSIEPTTTPNTNLGAIQVAPGAKF